MSSSVGSSRDGSGSDTGEWRVECQGDEKEWVRAPVSFSHVDTGKRLYTRKAEAPAAEEEEDSYRDEHHQLDADSHASDTTQQQQQSARRGAHVQRAHNDDEEEEEEVADETYGREQYSDDSHQHSRQQLEDEEELGLSPEYEHSHEVQGQDELQFGGRHELDDEEEEHNEPASPMAPDDLDDDGEEERHDDVVAPDELDDPVGAFPPSPSPLENALAESPALSQAPGPSPTQAVLGSSPSESPSPHARALDPSHPSHHPLTASQSSSRSSQQQQPSLILTGLDAVEASVRANTLRADDSGSIMSRGTSHFSSLSRSQSRSPPHFSAESGESSPSGPLLPSPSPDSRAATAAAVAAASRDSIPRMGAAHTHDFSSTNSYSETLALGGAGRHSSSAQKMSLKDASRAAVVGAQGEDEHEEEYDMAESPGSYPYPASFATQRGRRYEPNASLALSDDSFAQPSPTPSPAHTRQSLGLIQGSLRAIDPLDNSWQQLALVDGSPRDAAISGDSSLMPPFTFPPTLSSSTGSSGRSLAIKGNLSTSVAPEIANRLVDLLLDKENEIYIQARNMRALAMHNSQRNNEMIALISGLERNKAEYNRMLSDVASISPNALVGVPERQLPASERRRQPFTVRDASTIITQQQFDQYVQQELPQAMPSTSSSTVASPLRSRSEFASPRAQPQQPQQSYSQQPSARGAPPSSSSVASSPEVLREPAYASEHYTPSRIHSAREPAEGRSSGLKTGSAIFKTPAIVPALQIPSVSLPITVSAPTTSREGAPEEPPRSRRGPAPDSDLREIWDAAAENSSTDEDVNSHDGQVSVHSSPPSITDEFILQERTLQERARQSLENDQKHDSPLNRLSTSQSRQQWSVRSPPPLRVEESEESPKAAYTPLSPTEPPRWPGPAATTGLGGEAVRTTSMSSTQLTETGTSSHSSAHSYVHTRVEAPAVRALPVASFSPRSNASSTDGSDVDPFQLPAGGATLPDQTPNRPEGASRKEAEDRQMEAQREAQLRHRQQQQRLQQAEARQQVYAPAATPVPAPQPIPSVSSPATSPHRQRVASPHSVKQQHVQEARAAQKVWAPESQYASRGRQRPGDDEPHEQQREAAPLPRSQSQQPPLPSEAASSSGSPPTTEILMQQLAQSRHEAAQYKNLVVRLKSDRVKLKAKVEALKSKLAAARSGNSHNSPSVVSASAASSVSGAPSSGHKHQEIAERLMRLELRAKLERKQRKYLESEVRRLSAGASSADQGRFAGASDEKSNDPYEARIFAQEHEFQLRLASLQQAEADLQARAQRLSNLEPRTSYPRQAAREGSQGRRSRSPSAANGSIIHILPNEDVDLRHPSRVNAPGPSHQPAPAAQQPPRRSMLRSGVAAGPARARSASAHRHPQAAPRISPDQLNPQLLKRTEELAEEQRQALHEYRLREQDRRAKLEEKRERMRSQSRDRVRPAPVAAAPLSLFDEELEFEQHQQQQLRHLRDALNSEDEGFERSRPVNPVVSRQPEIRLRSSSATDIAWQSDRAAQAKLLAQQDQREMRQSPSPTRGQHRFIREEDRNRERDRLHRRRWGEQ